MDEVGGQVGGWLRGWLGGSIERDAMRSVQVVLRLTGCGSSVGAADVIRP